MFSAARFNATRLNIAATVNEILLQAVFAEMLQANMGVTVEYRVDSIGFAAMLEQKSIGSTAIPTGYSLNEVLDAAASPFLVAPIDAVFAAETKETKIHGKANYYMEAELAESVSGAAKAGCNVWFALPMEGQLSVAAAAGANVAAELIFTELLTLRADASAQEEQVLLVRVTVPVGSELRIDSENYTVTLDGENILHLQEGDWLAAERGLVSLMVDSGTKGQMEGQLVVRERYL